MRTKNIVTGTLAIFFPILIWLLYRILDLYLPINGAEACAFIFTAFMGTAGLVIYTIEVKD